MFGLLPPNSSVTGIRFCDAYWMAAQQHQDVGVPAGERGAAQLRVLVCDLPSGAIGTQNEQACSSRRRVGGVGSGQAQQGQVVFDRNDCEQIVFGVASYLAFHQVVYAKSTEIGHYVCTLHGRCATDQPLTDELADLGRQPVPRDLELTRHSGVPRRRGPVSAPEPYLPRRHRSATGPPSRRPCTPGAPDS
jgi:hypothetical protein